MPEFRTVIAGVDFSECSRNALKEAVRIAQGRRATLHVVHIIDPERIEDLQEYHAIATDVIVAKAKDQLDSVIAEDAPDALNLTSEVVLGHPFDELVRASAEYPESLLVLGAHGFRETTEVTGTVATKCVRKVPVPVLLVRKSQNHPFQTIVSCVDFSDTSEAAARMGAKVALQDGASMELVHVYFPPWMQPTSVQYNLTAAPTADYRKQYLGILEEGLDLVRQALEKEFPQLKVSTRLIERNNAATGIIEYLSRKRAALAVVGTRGRAGLKALLFGTTAERIVNESPCSILAVKPEGFRGPLF